MQKAISYVRQKYALQLRFLMVGGFNTLLGIAAYPVLYVVIVPLQSHYNILLVLTHLLCITTSYLTNKYLVFKTRGVCFWEYLRFTLFYNIIFVINLGLLPLLVQWQHLNPAKVQVAINLFIAAASYFWHTYVTFRRNKAVMN